jgi:hypothetical protein
MSARIRFRTFDWYGDTQRQGEKLDVHTSGWH